MSEHNWRFERKFLIQGLQSSQVEIEIKLNPGMFSKIYEPRQVNSIYFDSPGFENVRDNVEGVFERTKIRVRWYGDTFGQIEEPVLELKIKRGLAGRKERYPLGPFGLERDRGLNGLFEVLATAELPERLQWKMAALQPTLLNSYWRKYFLSSDGHFRITLDEEMTVYKPVFAAAGFVGKQVSYKELVIEMKYESEAALDQTARKLTSRFPFRMTKNSKYVNGIHKLYCFG